MVKDEIGHSFNFQPFQIVYLEHQGYRLYGEVVQVVEARLICWVRPLGMVADGATQQLRFHKSVDQIDESAIDWVDLRQGSDLLLPLQLFQPALDVDILPLLNYLYTDPMSSSQEKLNGNNHQKLNGFIRQLWAAFPESFRNST
jgi:hypothetical protein